MKGTVTISLEDFEELKESVKWHKHYLDKAVEQVELLEEVEEVLQSEENLAPYVDLIVEIRRHLDGWYN